MNRHPEDSLAAGIRRFPTTIAGRPSSVTTRSVIVAPTHCIERGSAANRTDLSFPATGTQTILSGGFTPPRCAVPLGGIAIVVLLGAAAFTLNRSAGAPGASRPWLIALRFCDRGRPSGSAFRRLGSARSCTPKGSATWRAVSPKGAIGLSRSCRRLGRLASFATALAQIPTNITTTSWRGGLSSRAA